jgi:hypothetical protein
VPDQQDIEIVVPECAGIEDKDADTGIRREVVRIPSGCRGVMIVMRVAKRGETYLAYFRTAYVQIKEQGKASNSATLA